MIWLQLTSSQNRRTIYVNAKQIIEIQEWNGGARLMTAASSGSDGRISAAYIYTAEAAAVVMDMIADAGAALVRPDAQEP